MKKGPLLLCFLACCFAAAGQLDKAKFDELQKKLLKQRDSVLNLPHVKKHQQNPNAGLPAAQQPAQPGAGGRASNFDKLELPKKDSVRLSKIPKKVFSASELQAYVTKLHADIAKNLPAATVAKANQLYEQVKNDPADIETAAMMALHSGEDELAVLVITKGASVDGDGMLLTNAGGILDMSGLSDKAIPILRMVVQKSPDNAAAHNNLGQAYTALGQHDSAMHYLKSAISHSPEHPEANNTAGVIELKRGNKAAAQVYFENSIRGGFNTSAYQGLKHILKEKTRITPLVKPKVKMPEYFNQFKFKLPRQQEILGEADEVEWEQKQFRYAVGQATRIYQALGKEAAREFAKKSPQQRNKEIQDRVMNRENYMRPFQVLGGIMEAEAMLDQQKDFQDLAYFNKQNREQYKKLELEYKQKYDAIWKRYQSIDDGDCCGEGNVSCCDDDNFCRETNALKKEYMPKFVELNKEYQTRNLHIEIQHLDNMLYWGFFAAWDRDDYKVRFYGRVADYLRKLQQLDVVKIFRPCAEIAEEDSEKKKEEAEVKHMECPFSIEIPLGVAKISLDCETFSVKLGKGLVMNYKKNFVSRQSTWSLGAMETVGEKKLTYGGFEAKINMSVYITFDGAGNVHDGGLVSEVKASANYGFDKAEKLKIKEGIGWRLGYNTGLSLTGGRLKNLIDKIGPAPETQVNPNIRIYKPGDE